MTDQPKNRPLSAKLTPKAFGRQMKKAMAKVRPVEASAKAQEAQTADAAPHTFAGALDAVNRKAGRK